MGMPGNILKYWKYYAIATAVISIGGWLYVRGGTDTSNEERWFSTKKIKYETETYIQQRPSAAQEQRALILDSIENTTTIRNNESAIKSRAKRDSTYFEEVKARRITDSINLLNADQLFQIKEEFKGIKEELQRIKN